MLPYIGDGADGGLCPPALEAVVFPVGGNLIQHAEIGRKQQCAVVQQPPLYYSLRAAGDFQIPDGNVADPVLSGGNTDGIQRSDNRRQHIIIIPSAVRPDNICVVDVSQIVIDGSAAGHPPHDRDAQPPQRLHVDLPADVLIAAHHDGRAVLPEKENIIVWKCLVDVLFKRLIIKRIVGKIPNGKHQRKPAFFVDCELLQPYYIG